ncbi:MAG: class I SAM-dependent methyltransferase [Planctomycetota bacterium]|jgi:SAM-dependent methyltransferase
MREAEIRIHKELEDVHWWFRGRRRVVLTLVRRFLRPSDGAVLEVGCGTGGNLRRLAAAGYRVLGLEPDPRMAAVARRRAGCPVLEGGLPDGLSVIEADVAAVLLLDVLEHIKDDEGALRAVAAFLPRGGWLIVTVPAFPSLWSYHDESFGHIRRYAPEQLRRRLRGAGFEVAWLSCFNIALLPAAVCVRAVRRLLGPTEGKTDFYLPPRALNALLAGVFGFEAVLAGRVRVPFGLSLCAVARVPGAI